MKWDEKIHPEFGRSLCADNGVVEVIIPLTYGIRIAHFSYLNEENVFFVQSKYMRELTTDDGWRIRGGHRLWLAPENEDTYRPDNDEVSYEIQGDEIIITQNIDLWLGVKKSIRVSFDEDACIHLTHKIENCCEETITRSLWGISVMAPGGTEYIPLGYREGEMSHWRRISWWDHTCLGDVRATYDKEMIRIRHLPIQEKYKIGVGHPDGPIQYENKDVIFEKDYEFRPEMTYPDGNVSFETFLCRHMVEIESLSPLYTLAPGESAEHKETWRLKRV